MTQAAGWYATAVILFFETFCPNLQGSMLLELPSQPECGYVPEGVMHCTHVYSVCLQQYVYMQLRALFTCKTSISVSNHLDSTCTNLLLHLALDLQVFDRLDDKQRLVQSPEMSNNFYYALIQLKIIHISDLSITVSKNPHLPTSFHARSSEARLYQNVVLW